MVFRKESMDLINEVCSDVDESERMDIGCKDYTSGGNTDYNIQKKREDLIASV